MRPTRFETIVRKPEQGFLPNRGSKNYKVSAMLHRFSIYQRTDIALDINNRYHVVSIYKNIEKLNIKQYSNISRRISRTNKGA